MLVARSGYPMLIALLPRCGKNARYERARFITLIDLGQVTSNSAPMGQFGAAGRKRLRELDIRHGAFDRTILLPLKG